MKEITIRRAEYDDLNRIMEIERKAFPPEEAAEKDTFQYRIENFGEWFYVVEKNGKIAGCINGRLTDAACIEDCLYEMNVLPEGPYFALLSVETAAEFQRQGVAEALIKQVITQAQDCGLQGIVLACKEDKIPYYSKFGFEGSGHSKSEHGGAQWYDMVLKLK